MNKLATKAIVLKRTNYSEADRIVRLITADSGKISVIAKGVRRVRSKLSGGIELFSICDISVVKGRGDLMTLTSARLDKHFDEIVKDFEKSSFGFEALKIIDRITGDDAEGGYFKLLSDILYLLNTEDFSYELAAAWFYMNLMRLNGSLPNLLTDLSGDNLMEGVNYAFSIEDGGFFRSEVGNFSDTEIKGWRVLISARKEQLKLIGGLDDVCKQTLKSIQLFAEYQL